MSIHVHVYLEDIDMQLAVVFIANTRDKSFDKSAHLCSLARAFATHIQNINTCTANPFLCVRHAWNDMLLLKLLFASPLNMQSLERRVDFRTSWICAFALKLLKHHVSQYVGIEMCLYLSLCQSTFVCHGKCHLFTQSSQLHSIKELLFQLR